ncbi:DUF2798 domain-containing protein [Gallicola sp. Sow4_E12]|uniref:DUF2798 domain-containing protein n=1 Tax=Gallicola sp. Sow4_E12 TaxID=3438785 RepID=UPI003F8DDC3D
MKSNKIFKPILFGTLMAIGMSFFMSLAMIIKNVGITADFFKILISEWAFATIISLIPSILLPPVIEKIIGKIIG